jgi:serine/threonine-protein kinase
MGEVWKARDTRLDRIVAIKCVSPAYAARFQQEARAIAALNHPHICQIHDVGSDYLVLEYVEGRTVQGPMTDAEAVRLAIQIAAALEAAHQRGILHRDLKPANVIVSHSRSDSVSARGMPNAKLLDFGLAKSVAPDADVTQTVEGTIVGTLAYMSPEQAQGLPMDARSDVFSFGALLYEMLGGRRAFDGDTAAQILAAVLRDDPAPLQTSPAIDRIVRRCLAKDPADRFNTMTEVKTALEQLSAQPADGRPSIAVLPFADMSPGKENDYFGDGLAEEIINALGQVPGLKVIARTSAFAFKGQNTDVRQIAETLGVTNILEGSVRRSGNRLRVTAQLIAAADGSQLWSERFDRELADVFDVQDDITNAITAALKTRLSVEPAPRRHKPGMPAYDAYLRARYFLAKETPEALESSRRYLEEAIALDPGFALAHAWLSALYVHLVGFTLRPARETIPLVRAHAQRAVELEPSLSEAHTMLGVVAAAHDYNWTEAARCFRLAMARDPIPSLTRFNYGLHYLLPLGRAAEAVEEIELGLRDDPVNIVRHVHAAFAYAAAGRPDDARSATQHALELDEKFWIALLQRSIQETLEGHLTAALLSAQQAHASAPWSFAAVGFYAGLLAVTGQTERAEGLLQTLGNGEAFGAPLGLMQCCLFRQDVEQAAYWARKGIEQRDIDIPMMLRHPGVDSLRTSSHWPALARMMNLPDA